MTEPDNVKFCADCGCRTWHVGPDCEWADMHQEGMKMKKEPWEKQLDAHDGNSRDDKLRELVDQWKSEAASLQAENAEAARIFARCADQLALLVYRGR